MPVGPPATPTLSSCAGGNSSVTLTWTAPDNNGSPITNYDVLVGTSASSLTVSAVTGAVTSHTVSGLVNGTTYYFALVATNAEGDSARSTVISCVAASVPSGPVLSSVTPANGSATLTWTTPSGNGAPVTGFKIFRGTTSTNLTLLATVGVQNTYTNTGLTNGTTYYYAVSASNSTGESIRSNVVSCTPAAASTTTTSTTTIPTTTTSLPPGNVNDPDYWSALGYGYCFKNNSPNTPYVLGNPPSGYYWTLLVLKAGSEASNSDWLTQIPNPVPGTYYHPSGKQISHVIYCKKPNSGSTTTTPGSTTTAPGSTTTTTIPATTTTVVGAGCIDYTPTQLAISNSSAEPGQSVTITGSGVPGDNLVITIKRPGYPDDTIGFAVVDGFGNFSVVVTIPDSYSPGNYSITVRSHDCICPTSSSTTAHHGDDDDDNGDDDDGYYGSRSYQNSGGDDDDGHGDDDDGSNSDNPCAGATKINISVTSLDLSGCGTNSYDRVFTPGETITWHLMGSPFDVTKPPVTLTLVSRTPGGPSYTLYSGVYPGSLDVTVTIPAGAPTDRYYLNQSGKKSNNKVITKSCPVRVGIDAASGVVDRHRFDRQSFGAEHRVRRYRTHVDVHAAVPASPPRPPLIRRPNVAATPGVARRATRRRWSQPADIAMLVWVRVAVGGVLCWELWRYLDLDYPRRYYADPPLHFTFWPFDWVRPAPPGVMTWLFIGGCRWRPRWSRSRRVLQMGVRGPLAGTHLRLPARSSVLPQSLVPPDVARVPAGVHPADAAWSIDTRSGAVARRSEVPAWTVGIFRFQIGVVYAFAGLAKLESDWLGGRPMRIWLRDQGDFPVIGGWLSTGAPASVLAIAAAIFDIALVPLLCSRRTRRFAYPVSIAFHLMNSRLFSIGMFPWAMMLMTATFFPADFPRRMITDLRSGRRRLPTLAGAITVGWLSVWLPQSYYLMTTIVGVVAGAVAGYHLGGGDTPADLSEAPGAPEAAGQRGTPAMARRVVSLLAVWMAIQVALPLRPYVYPGNAAWTEEGQQFSWRLLLRTKSGVVRFDVSDPETGEVVRVFPEDYLSGGQLHNLGEQPDMLVQFARWIESELRPSMGGHDLEVRARTSISLNGHRAGPLVDPGVDLTEVARPWLPGAEWIMPQPED